MTQTPEPADFPHGASVGGLCRITETVRGEPSRGQYRAEGLHGSESYLVTLVGPVHLNFAEVQEELALPAPGIARLAYCGELHGTPGGAYAALVEEEPKGTPLRDWAESPGTVSETARLGLGIGRIVEQAHTRGFLAGALRPELIYGRRDQGPEVCGIAPRCEAFIAKAPPSCHGTLPLFDRLYVAPERITGAPLTKSSEVFCLALILAEWSSGTYPYPTQTALQQAMAIGTGQPDLTRVPAALRPILERALARSPQTRPTLPQLMDQLSKVV